MDGSRARRWIERLRARFFGGGGARDRTATSLFTARSSPPDVTERPPSATARAQDAHAPSVNAPGGGSPDQATPARADQAGGRPAANAPGVRVHDGRLDRQVGPLELSPTEALRLASEGQAGLRRRDLPPDPGATDLQGRDASTDHVS